MSGWAHHVGLGVALPREGIDTDQLIPARFMSTPRSAGYGDFLLHDMRKDSNGMQPAFDIHSALGDAKSIIGRDSVHFTTAGQ